MQEILVLSCIDADILTNHTDIADLRLDGDESQGLRRDRPDIHESPARTGVLRKRLSIPFSSPSRSGAITNTDSKFDSRQVPIWSDIGHTDM